MRSLCVRENFQSVKIRFFSGPKFYFVRPGIMSTDEENEDGLVDAGIDGEVCASPSHETLTPSLSLSLCLSLGFSVSLFLYFLSRLVGRC